MSFPDAVIHELLDHYSGTYGAALYVALWDGDPGSGGTGGAELAGGGYARVQHASWNAAAGRVMTNSGAIAFPLATSAWGNWTHVALWSAASGGTFRGAGPITNPQTIATGSVPQVADAAMVFAMEI